jgi:hypothetical protein
VAIQASTICQAIRERRLLEFEYEGRHRIVAPYCHGRSRTGQESLRAVQIAGETRSGGFGYGKLWSVAKMSRVSPSMTPFVADDPDYNPDDTAMVEIHCRVEREPIG